MNDRYRENDPVPTYTHKDVRSGKVGAGDGSKPVIRPLAAIDIIKLCDCLEYQSCEHLCWDASWACDFLDRVRKCATGKLPGYEAAPWGLHD